MIAPPTLVQVVEGNTVLLTCVALGYPRPNITWTNYYSGASYGNGAVTDRHRVTETVMSQNGVEFVTSVFEICGVEFEDAGQYRCVAESSSGATSVRFNITVEEPLGVCVCVSRMNSTGSNKLENSCV